MRATPFAVNICDLRERLLHLAAARVDSFAGWYDGMRNEPCTPTLAFDNRANQLNPEHPIGGQPRVPIDTPRSKADNARPGV
jgi:hypothetical protein